jgi:hypothetical protein
MFIIISQESVSDVTPYLGKCDDSQDDEVEAASEQRSDGASQPPCIASKFRSFVDLILSPLPVPWKEALEHDESSYEPRKYLAFRQLFGHSHASPVLHFLLAVILKHKCQHVVWAVFAI